MRLLASILLMGSTYVSGLSIMHEGHKIDKNLNNIFAQNKAWKQRLEEKDPNYFKHLGSTHNPSYMWIGCADARVPANEIMGEDAGSVFVLRSVANLVVGTDFNLMAALQFAVDYLKIPHIIVCGHYDCGGIRASMESKDHVPPLENWLRNIRDVYRLHKKELDSIKDPESRHRRLVELNVVEQCVNLFKTGVVQRARIESFKQGTGYTTPRIHAVVFDPKTGEMNKLTVNFKEIIDELHDIYDLYDPPPLRNGHHDHRNEKASDVAPVIPSIATAAVSTSSQGLKSQKNYWPPSWNQ